MSSAVKYYRSTLGERKRHEKIMPLILHERFPGNAVCDSGYYDNATDSYVFPIGVYENFYDLKITKYEKIARNIYRAEIEKTHSLTDKIDPVKISMILEISGDSYRYLAVKYE